MGVFFSDLMGLPLSVEEYISRIRKQHEYLFPAVSLMPGISLIKLDHSKRKYTFEQHITCPLADYIIEYWTIKAQQTV